MELIKKKKVGFKRGECCTNLNHLILIWMEGKSLDGFASPGGGLNVKEHSWPRLAEDGRNIAGWLCLAQW